MVTLSLGFHGKYNVEFSKMFSMGQWCLLSHSSPMERAFEAGSGSEIKEEDRDNSIFVSAFKRHLQSGSGSLKERLDTLLTDSAAGKRIRFLNLYPFLILIHLK